MKHLLKEEKDIQKKSNFNRIRMIGIQQSYYMHDCADFKIAKRMNKILEKEDYQNYNS